MTDSEVDYFGLYGLSKCLKLLSWHVPFELKLSKTSKFTLSDQSQTSYVFFLGDSSTDH